ncbi:MAG: class I SAM-dependent methyltransferase [Proteobacteria bacterium]|nr:class I SAM-dependent methyltransferase [Pseudomonadota bacterium]
MTVYHTQKDYWDDAALEKEFTTPFQMELFCRYVPYNAPVLDVGCGYGRTLNELYEKGFQSLHGIDFSLKMIERGLSLFPHLDISQHSKPHLPYPDNSFDAVILLAVLTCITEDEAQENLIQEILRILKPKGVLYINDFLLNHDERNRTRYQLSEKKYGCYGIFELPEGARLRHFEESRIRELTRSFEPCVFEKTVYKTMNGNTSNGFYFLGKKSVGR